MGTVIRQVVVNRPFTLPRRPIESQEVPNLLLTTLAPIALGNPFRSIDWPNPIQVRRLPIVDYPQNLFSSTITPAPNFPFNTDDWPVPRGYHRNPIGNLTHIFYYVSDSVGPPNYNYDFPNPSGYKFVGSVHGGFVNGLDLSNIPPPPQAVFGLTDPVPRGYQFGVGLRGFVQAIPQTLIPLPTPPFFGSTFPNPTLRTFYNQRPETVSLLASGQLHPLPPPTYFGASGMTVRGT